MKGKKGPGEVPDISEGWKLPTVEGRRPKTSEMRLKGEIGVGIPSVTKKKVGINLPGLDRLYKKAEGVGAFRQKKESPKPPPFPKVRQRRKETLEESLTKLRKRWDASEVRMDLLKNEFGFRGVYKRRGEKFEVRWTYISKEDGFWLVIDGESYSDMLKVPFGKILRQVGRVADRKPKTPYEYIKNYWQYLFIIERLLDQILREEKPAT